MDRPRLQPYWTASETSMLVDVWKDLESSLSATRTCRQDVPDGLDGEISAHLTRHTKIFRSHDAVQTHRHRIYKFVRFIRSFDAEQQVSGGRFWFGLSAEEQNQVAMSQADRKMGSILTRFSVNKLMTIASVKKRTKPRKSTANSALVQTRPKKQSKASFKVAQQKRTEPYTTIMTGYNAGVAHDNYLTSKCNLCWSSTEVLELVRAWGQVLQRLQISVDMFAKMNFELAADLYTPHGRSPMSAWRKMKRIVSSFQFIQEFNDQHCFAQWFELSDVVQNEHINWKTLPNDFENIGQDVFNEINRVDSVLGANRDDFAVLPVDSNAQSTSVNIEDTQGPAQLQEAIALCKAELREESPQSPHRRQKQLLLGSTQHRECNFLLENIVNLQSNQLHQQAYLLHVDINRILRRNTKMISTLFFDTFGQPDKAENSSLVEKLLEDQHQRIREHFAYLEDDFDHEQAASSL